MNSVIRVSSCVPIFLVPRNTWKIWGLQQRTLIPSPRINNKYNKKSRWVVKIKSGSDTTTQPMGRWHPPGPNLFRFSNSNLKSSCKSFEMATKMRSKLTINRESLGKCVHLAKQVVNHHIRIYRKKIMWNFNGMIRLWLRQSSAGSPDIEALNNHKPPPFVHPRLTQFANPLSKIQYNYIYLKRH